MTILGKLLAFLNLVAGIGIITWSVSVLTLPPAWFEPIPEGVDKGHSPVTFAMMKSEADRLGREANVASGRWGAELTVLEETEKRWKARRKVYAQRLELARNGDKDGNNAFFEPEFEKDTTFLDTTKVGKAIIGADNQPLKGAEKLLDKFNANTKTIAERAKEIETLRKQQGFDDLPNNVVSLTTKIGIAEARQLKMNEIRDTVQSELFFLSTFEVNVFETRETVLRRKRQLAARLDELKSKD